MKLKIQPVRQMKKGKTKVWVNCEDSCAQAYDIVEVRKAGFTTVRRERSRAEAERIIKLFTKPKPPRDRNSMVGKRWTDVQAKL